MRSLNLRLRLIPYILLLVPFILLYKDTFVRLFKGWFTFEESHGLLILAITFYMIWQKREELKDLSFQPDLFKGAIVLITGCFTLIAGKLSHTYIIQDFSLIFIILGIVLLFGGFLLFKTLFLPLSYLIFMFPVFSELLGNISLSLQQITAFIGANILKIAGMPVLLSKQFIELPHIALEVAKACNGINHIMALVALSIPLAIITHHTFTKKVLLVLIAFAIGILANGLRVAFIGLWSAYRKGGPTHGPHDIFYVSSIFFFGLALLIIINHLLKKGDSKKQGIAKVPKRTDKIIPASQTHRPFLYPAVLTSLILLSTLAYLYSFQFEPVFLRNSLKEFPKSIENWNGRDILSVPDFLSIKADEELNRIYQNDSKGKVELYIRYFNFQEKGRSITDYRFALPEYQKPSLRIAFGDDKFVKINKIVLSKPSHQKVIYYWYEIKGETLHHPYKVKWIFLWEALLKRHTNGAFVLLISEIGENDTDFDGNALNFIQTLMPIIKKSLTS